MLTYRQVGHLDCTATFPDGNGSLTCTDRITCHNKVVIAILKVETDGKGGFFAPNKPAILFDGYIFWSQLKKKGIAPKRYVTGNENILYPKWEKGHYKGGPLSTSVWNSRTG